MLALVDLWERIKAPRNPRTPERARKAFGMLAKVIGHDVGPKSLTQAHIVAFRDANATLPESMQTKYLDCVRAVIAVAVSEGVMPANVAAGIRPRRSRGQVSARRQEAAARSRPRRCAQSWRRPKR